MKIYVITTGAVFGLLTVAHIWRAFYERHLATEPFFVLATIATAIFCLWAVVVVRRVGHGK